MIRRQIPNLITLCNLLCGVIAVYTAIAVGGHEGRFAASLFICLGILFDFFDGMSARLLHVQSDMGKELDSLADVVTSGVAPAMILLNLFHEAAVDRYLAIVAFLIPLFAAYRLAKFNLDCRQSHSFLGLPVPSNALIWVGVGLAGWMPSTTIGWVALCVVSLLTDVLMVSELPMFSLKFNFRDLSWRSNSIQYIFLVGCALLLALVRSWLVISAFICWYIVLSLLTQRSHHAD